RDSNGTPVVKYGFTLKQWFVNRGNVIEYNYSRALSWCNSLGYRLPKVKDLTNASCLPGGFNYNRCRGSVSATPSSPNNHYMRHIGSGFLAEWGKMEDYAGVGFFGNYEYRTSDSRDSGHFIVPINHGDVGWFYNNISTYGLCSHP
ncbi:hypothetical protein, partial [Gilliamella sp. B3372]